MEKRYKFLSIEQFNDLLKNWNNDQIKISKLEMNDLDEIVMQLEKVTYLNEAPTIDGYEPVHTLQLNGHGIIQTDNNDSQPLPSSIYEIPLENDTLYEFNGTTFLISTDRGVYKIERVDERSS
ncbi:hypothetical protein [Pseudogracilibacillus sp. SO30301A]|uniref:hypothetical protein n=1 Tax=Pseudogracilibacillus sp. SO30301A TaxID=3098291 RepID=UPI00300DF7FE